MEINDLQLTSTSPNLAGGPGGGVFFARHWSSGLSPQNLTIRNCVIYNQYNGVRILGQDVAYANNIVIENTEIYNTYDDGVYMQYADNVTINNSYIHNVNVNFERWLEEYPNGIYCPANGHTYMYCPGDKAYDIPSVCQGVIPYSCPGDVIQLIAGVNQVISNNVLDKSIAGNKFAIIVSSTLAMGRKAGTLIEGNEIYGPNPVNGGATAVYTALRDDVIIRNNILHAPNNSGIFVYQTNTAEVYGNIITGSLDKGLSADNGTLHVNAFNNVFYDLHGYAMIHAPGNLDATNNIFYNEPGDTVKNYLSPITGSNNLYLNNTSDMFGTNNIIGNPLFVDTSSYNFRLLLNSPAINHGVNVERAEDPDGVIIPQGPEPDIGVYEYQ
jgi:hypothetical protein